jgi:hypothetical protein
MAGRDQKGRVRALTPPDSVLNALMGQTSHSEACVRDSETGIFFGKNSRSCIYGLTLRLRLSHGAGRFDAMSQNQTMNLTHGRSMAPNEGSATWTFPTGAIRKVLDSSY